MNFKTTIDADDIEISNKARSIIRRRSTIYIATFCVLAAALLLSPGSFFGGETSGHTAAGSASLFGNCQPLIDEIAQLESDKADLQKELQNASPKQKVAIIAEIKKINDQIADLNVKLHDCQCPITPPPTSSLLELTGSADMTDVHATGSESFSMNLNLKNLTASPVTITRAELFFACAGGWAFTQGDLVASSGTFLGVPPMLPANVNYTNLQYVWSWSNPVEYVIFVVEATSGGKTQELITQIPVNRAGYKTLPVLPAERRVFIGLQEPLEVITLTNGKKWLTVIGEVINGTGEPVSLDLWHLTLFDSQNSAVVWSDSSQKFFDANFKAASFDSSATLNRFLYGFELPANFTEGKLTIDSDLVLSGSCQSVIRVADVKTAPTPRPELLSPVRDTWNWGNGPGRTYFSSHTANSEQRYAYDLAMVKMVNGKSQAYDGDPALNESYFGWNQPIYCVEDGIVLAVDDSIVDNKGNQGVDANKENPGKNNSYIVVGHYGGTQEIDHYSMYVHIRKGSANVIPNQPVSAGHVLARVGNAGQSSGPHLHFSYFRIDETGHPLALPMQFKNLWIYIFPMTLPVSGVPIGDVEYISQ